MKEKAKQRLPARWPLLLLLLFSPLACSEGGLSSLVSDETLSLFFDIPPPTEAELAAKAEAEAKLARERKAEPAGGAAALADEEAERPMIEAVLDYERVGELLPLDEMDEIDWMAALRQEIIKPRHAIAGPKPPGALVFKFDFIMPGPEPDYDAFFPHSSHTQWVGCDSCHPKIFPSRGTEITMDGIMEGEYCGVCHGRVAFATDSCGRCHLAMAEE